MKDETEIIDEFEYKGIIISVHKDSDGKCYFRYINGEEEVSLPIEDIKSFIGSSFSHTTINNTPIDIIEKSVKINDLLYNLGDLKMRIKKYN
tara:strand:- start:1561 stop:1836 length:276 start_codon:yes stop_codon:yes gene_type:complete